MAIPLFEDFKEELKSLKEKNDKLRILVKAADNEVKTFFERTTIGTWSPSTHKIKPSYS